MLGFAGNMGRDARAAHRLAQAHLAEVERKFLVLESLSRKPRQLVGACRSGTVSRCRIIEALAFHPDRTSRRTPPPSGRPKA